MFKITSSEGLISFFLIGKKKKNQPPLKHNQSKERKEQSSGAELLGMHTESVTLQLFQGRLFLILWARQEGERHWQLLKMERETGREGEGARAVFILRNEGSKERFILQQGSELLLALIESFAPGSWAELRFGALERRTLDPWVNAIKKVRPRGAGGGSAWDPGSCCPQPLWNTSLRFYGNSECWRRVNMVFILINVFPACKALRAHSFSRETVLISKNIRLPSTPDHPTPTSKSLLWKNYFKERFTFSSAFPSFFFFFFPF